MPETKTSQAATDKWARRVSLSGQDYVEGTRGKGGKWLENTVDAEQNYNTGVQEAISRGSFAQGVQNAGPTSWEEGVQSVGAGRFTTGATARKGKYEEAIRPVLDVIQSVNLSPRGPRGSAQNYTRVQEIGDALNQARLAGRL